jgi:hypothetical protein
MFEKWSSGGSGNDNPYTITVNSDTQIDVNFKYGDRALTINATGSGTGSVTASNGSKSGWGGGTTSTFPAVYGYHWDDVVTLTPVADAGSAFYAWTGDGSGAPVRTVDILDADRSVTVEFRKTYVLTVTTSDGTGSESVGLAPAPVSSAGDDHTYFENTVVTLTANPDTTAPGYSVFKQWTGDASGSANPTTVTMTADKAVDAGFANAYMLTMLGPDGTGTGSVSPAIGDHFYEQGEVVSISATPDPGSGFIRWNDIMMTGNITDPNSANTTVTMNSDTIINATIDDVPDPPTDIDLDNSSVDENSPVDTLVGTLSTTDLDAGDTHTYTIQTPAVQDRQCG